jgi:hypothetical protein
VVQAPLGTPTRLLHPKLDHLARRDREQLLEDAKLEARSSTVLMSLIVAWLLICVAAWLILPTDSRNSLGFLMYFVPALGVAVLRFWGIQVALRRSLAIHQAFEASRRSQ